MFTNIRLRGEVGASRTVQDTDVVYDNERTIPTLNYCLKLYSNQSQNVPLYKVVRTLGKDKHDICVKRLGVWWIDRFNLWDDVVY